jgi:hypothetical protein
MDGYAAKDRAREHSGRARERHRGEVASGHGAEVGDPDRLPEDRLEIAVAIVFRA